MIGMERLEILLLFVQKIFFRTAKRIIAFRVALDSSKMYLSIIEDESEIN